MIYHDDEEGAREQWGKLVASLQEQNRQLKFLTERAEAKANRYELEAEKGRAFQKMLDFVNENPIAKSAWDRFVMTLKMVDNGTGN